MQVTVEDKSSVKKVLHIEIPVETVTGALDNAYKKLKKTAKIKGFRPGKAPRSVLERMFKKDVHVDVTGQLIQDSLISAIKEKELNILGDPQIDPPELNTEGPYLYDATVEIRPEIPTIDFSGLKLKKTLYKVSDREIEAQLEMLQKNMAKLEPIASPRPAQMGDGVIIDYEGFQNDKPFPATGFTENFSMKLGNGAISKSFDDQIVGMSADEEKTFDVAFDENHTDKELAGQTIQFKVLLREIREEILPELNDEFAKNFGPFEKLDDLKEKIFENLQEGYDKRIEQELNEQIFEALIAKTDFEVPDIMVQYELEGIIEEAQRAFTASNVTFEQLGITRESLEEKYRDTAVNQVRRHLILGAIIEHQNLEINDDELDQGYEDLARQFRQPVDGIKQFYQQNQDKVELLKHTLLEKKAIKLIIDSSEIEETEPELEDQADETDGAETS